MRRFSAGDHAQIEGRMRVIWIVLCCLCCCSSCLPPMARPPRNPCGGSRRPHSPFRTWSRWSPTFLPSPSRWRRSSRQSPSFCISLRGGDGCAASSDLEAQLAGARAKLERAALTMQGDRQVVICWDRSDSKPALDGDFALVADVPEATQVLDYASWLGDAAAAQVVEASERLLNRGKSFSLSAVSRRGRHIEISGRPVSGSAVMRIRDVSGDRLELAELREKAAPDRGSLRRASFGSSVGRHPRLETGRRRSHGLVQRNLRGGGRSAGRQGGHRQQNRAI